MSASPLSTPFPPPPPPTSGVVGVGPASPEQQQQHQLQLHLQQVHDNDQAAIRAAAAAVEAVHRAAAAPPAGYGVDDDDDDDEIPGLEDKRTKRGFSKRVTLRDLERYFEYPIEEVSKMMGVSTTIIKRLCRKYGIKRWPYRQVSEAVPFFCSPEVVSCVVRGGRDRRCWLCVLMVHPICFGDPLFFSERGMTAVVAVDNAREKERDFRCQQAWLFSVRHALASDFEAHTITYTIIHGRFF